MIDHSLVTLSLMTGESQDGVAAFAPLPVARPSIVLSAITMAQQLDLAGITWNHTRGYLPMLAVSQWFEDLSPEVRITWQKRSLKDFGDFPVEQLAERFDLLVIDHPFTGYAAAHHIFLPLEEILPSEFLTVQAENSVGRSFESYWYDGHLWALPIDAAAPVSSWRPDLLDALNVKVPEQWDEVCDLAERGLVIFPATPVDSLMNFLMFCCALGEEPFSVEDRVVAKEIGAKALGYQKQLLEKCPSECLSMNPIAVYRTMAFSNSAAYCPFAFSYSNYARPAQYPGAASGLSRPNPLHFGNLVALPGNRPLRSTLGGTGLAISSRCRNVDLAVEFVKAVTDPICQQGVYFSSGGQPAHRSAWKSTALNAASNSFFQNTLETLDNAYLRPRFNGYLAFQDEAGTIVHRFLREGGDCRPALRAIEDLRRAIEPAG